MGTICYLEIDDGFANAKPTLIKLEEAGVWAEEDKNKTHTVHIQCHANLKCVIRGLKAEVAKYMVQNIEACLDNGDDIVLGQREGMTVRFEAGRKKIVI